MQNDEIYNELFKKLTNLENLFQKNQLNQKKVLTLEEFCIYTGYSESTAYKLSSKRKVPHSKLGRTLFFDREKIEIWLLQNSIKTTEQIQEDLI